MALVYMSDTEAPPPTEVKPAKRQMTPEMELNSNQEKLDDLFSQLEFKPMPRNFSKQSPAIKEDSRPLMENRPEKRNDNYQTLFTRKDLKDWSSKLDKCKVLAPISRAHCNYLRMLGVRYPWLQYLIYIFAAYLLDQR